MTNQTEKTGKKSTENYKEMLIDKITYKIKVEIPMLRCSRFYMMKDDEIICMAKLKYDEIIIGEGNKIHI